MMNRGAAAVAAVCAMITLTACGRDAAHDAGNATATAATDTADAQPRLQPAAPAPAPATPALAPADQEFLVKAALSGVYEVTAANLALQKSSAEPVRQFAQQMLNDHGAMNQELHSLASLKDVALPAQLDATYTAAVDRLASLSGRDFDRAYMDEAVAAHQSVIAEFERAGAKTADVELRGWVEKALPILKSHMTLAQATAAEAAAPIR